MDHSCCHLTSQAMHIMAFRQKYLCDSFQVPLFSAYHLLLNFCIVDFQQTNHQMDLLHHIPHPLPLLLNLRIYYRNSFHQFFLDQILHSDHSHQLQYLGLMDLLLIFWLLLFFLVLSFRTTRILSTLAHY